MPLYEHYDLHPRAANWIECRGDAYLYEMRLSSMGIADFVCINRSMGQISIVECKLSERSTGCPIEQINRYSLPFEGMNIRRIALFLLPISISYRAYLMEAGLTPFVVGEDHPESRIIKRKEGLPIFNDLMMDFHDNTIEDLLDEFNEKRAREFTGKGFKISPLLPRVKP